MTDAPHPWFQTLFLRRSKNLSNKYIKQYISQYLDANKNCEHLNLLNKTLRKEVNEISQKIINDKENIEKLNLLTNENNILKKQIEGLEKFTTETQLNMKTQKNELNKEKNKNKTEMSEKNKTINKLFAEKKELISKISNLEKDKSQELQNKDTSIQ